MTTWTCPLCDFRTTGDDVLPSVVRHAIDLHPAHLPERQTIADMLDSLPRLLREAVATVDAPNPDGPRVKVSSSRTGPPELRSARLLRLANPGSESSLFADLVTCSRIIWEALDHDARKRHPQPVGDLSWAAELTWLRGVWDEAQAYVDEVDFDWIETEIKHISGVFAALAGIRPRPRNLCPDCRAPMHLDDSDWLTCDAGHQHPGPKRLEREWRRKAPMPTKDLCEKLRIGERTLLRYHHDKKIAPTRTEGRALWWLPWDVIGARYPDIVKSIEERDDAA